MNLLFKDFLKLKPSNRDWRIAALAGICVGSPLLLGWYFDQLSSGLISCLSALVILYLPARGSLTHKINTLMICSFGFMGSFALGQFFSFNPIAAVLAFGIFSLVLHAIILHYKAEPPRSFFLIMIFSISISQPFSLENLPHKIGLISLGTLLSTAIGLAYILYKRSKAEPEASQNLKSKDPDSTSDIWEAIIMGLFMALSLGLGYALKINNPYWIPISCAAVMQGASLNHIWQRSLQRIFGTLLGLGLCWLLLNSTQSKLLLCLYIIALQFIVEMLVTRNYALAVIFITPLAIFMSEAADPIINSPATLITLRFNEIVLGSLLGALGGWLLHKEKLRYFALKKLG